MKEWFSVTVTGVFCLLILANHVTKCTDVAVYDATLILLIILFLIVVHEYDDYKMKWNIIKNHGGS